MPKQKPRSAPAPVSKPAEKPAERPAAKPQPAATAAKATPAPAAVGTAATEGSPGNGFAVQVAALNARGEADAIARRLSAKGYAAYVQVPHERVGVQGPRRHVQDQA